MKPFLCPVCNGKGKIYVEDAYGGKKEKKCHGCHGKGWVSVPEDPVYFIPR